MQKIFMIDSISPFCRKLPKEKINWSKIPFDNLEKNEEIKKKAGRKILPVFDGYINKVCHEGYNSISLDELQKILIFDFYNPSLKEKIKKYRNYYQKLFIIAKKYKMKIFITTDVMFYNDDIKKHLGNNIIKLTDSLRNAIDELFIYFQDLIDGIIFRIGESDGIDIKSTFKSRVIINNSNKANLFIKSILPVFEQNKKLMIFRTWTIGIGSIGDLNWNTKRFKKVFNNIKSDNLIVSMKYGDGDFMRFYELNQSFFIKGLNKIIELQTRREYEGFGEIPSFVGWEYEKFHKQLLDENTFCGISVWCQTGGWSDFRRRTYHKNGSFWNRLNTFITIKMFKENISCLEALSLFFSYDQLSDAIDFLLISEEIIKRLYYYPEFASNTLFINRVRIPPILHIFWNNVTVNDTIISLYRNYSNNNAHSIEMGRDTLIKFKKLKNLQKKLRFDYDYDYHFDTIYILYFIREFILTGKETLLEIIDNLIVKYYNKHKYPYKFYISVTGKKRKITDLILKTIIRKRAKYRIIDRIIFNRLTSPLIMLLINLYKRNFPDFVNKQGMPIEKLLT